MTNLQLARYLTEAMWRLACMVSWVARGDAHKVRECEQWYRELTEVLDRMEDHVG